jgi:hypothetical protein
MKSPLINALLGLSAGIVFGVIVVYISYSPFVYTSHIDPGYIFAFAAVLFLIVEAWVIWVKKSASVAASIFIGVLVLLCHKFRRCERAGIAV